MIQVALDFAPGLHGHFLELVLNKYIYGVGHTVDNIFQSTGAVHVINVDPEYQKSKIVDRGHFSSFRYPYPSTSEKVVFINHCADLDVVLLTNIYHRCHADALTTADFDGEQIKRLHQSFMGAGNDLELRNNWFAKLNERHFEHAATRPVTVLPTYNFDYRSFFDLTSFCAELQKTARFLEKTFKFDSSLPCLWQEFIDRNQGWALYKQSESIIESALFEKNVEIPNDWKIHAYLNFRLSRMFDIQDGVLYNSKKYPSTTSELLSVVTNHIQYFNNRW